MSDRFEIPELPRPPPTEAAVFDVYGTLLDVVSLEEACRGVAPNPGAFVALWRGKQLEYSWLLSLMGRYEDFWTITAAALEHAAESAHLDLDTRSRAKLLDAWLKLGRFPEVPEALDRLATQPLAVLSNGSPRMLDEGLRAAGLRDRFDHILSVDAVRTYKPSPAVYELAERALDLPRERVLFVTANGWDAAGAASFGLRVAWLDRSGTAADRLGTAPDLVVRDLADLADRLAR